MDRNGLVRLLDRYENRHPDEFETIGRIRRLLADRERAFHRDCFDPGHITSSAWIVSHQSGAVLLTHHRKLERWLQLGGHADGQTDVFVSALREAEEESGLRGFESVPVASGPEILDVDVHEIPARADEPSHEHHDIRFLLRVSDDQPIERQVAESKEVRWFPAEGITTRFDEESLARMARKAVLWLARDPAGPA
jgi:8-oxo-dGTP pyrophosphatase MutT (NUDIX family)